MESVGVAVVLLTVTAAAVLPDPDTLVTEDHRTADAARGYGLPTSSPR